MTRVPELRFDGFAGEWEENIFDNLAEYKKGPFGSALKKSIFVPKSNETVKVYEQQNAIEKNWELERYFITREYANKMENFNVGPGDLIVSCAGTIGEMYELPNSAEEGIINQALMRIRVKDAIDKRFFNHIFDKMIGKSSARLSNGSAIKNIPPFSDLKPHKTYVPIYNEQEKIGDLFSKIDQLIENQQELVDQTMAFKKSMLQKMFPKKDSLVPKFRFEGFNDDWEISRLKNKTRLRGGFAFKSEFYTDFGVPILRISNINSDGTTNFDYVYYKEFVDDKNFTLEDGDIVLAMSGATTGKISVLNTDEKVYQNQRVGYFEKSELVNYKYLTAILKSDLFFQQLDRILIAGAQPNISAKEVEDFEFKFPSLEEQEKIGNFFKKLDEKIAREEKLLDAYKDMKKSLLQKMFV